ncbi:T9SS type A sorting domain-containing protein [Hymenobacter psychrotolerans]|uniref:Por secretion system C-terminal sorting domain-containing protein n=1 Tax=Hymenobacter psychrotolerans DSM 18569 TaxID=1121959 RepID=A0A1M7GRI9_9BACT|nr:T9SS type A sorting domain-containing protein [Hymenobacter psychrotolerans]SHM18479.1 Por secretion system C-terminal sorting domain-containing protein [Hymenobacter psychrotolerans DSM 18569]
MQNSYASPWRRLALVAALGLFSSAAQAQLATYSFLNAAGDEATFPVDAQPINASFSVMSRGAGVTPSAGGGAFAATGWSEGALDATDYFSFSVQPATGFQLRLDSLLLDERRSGTGIRDWAVRSSLDNFASNIITVNVPDDALTRTNKKVALPAGFNNLTTPVEFRIYGYTAEAAAGSWRIDNVRTYGLVTPVGGTTVPVASFSTGAVTVAENAGTIQIPVRLSTISAQPVTVEVALATPAGSASSPSDYTYTTQTVTFPANTTAAQNVTLTIVDDAVAESSETIILKLQNPLPAGSVTTDAGTYTVTITDNDTPTGPTISTVAALTVNDAAGVPTQNGQTVSARGTVYGTNQRTAGYQFTLIDNTGGIGLFAAANIGTTTLTEGDSVLVTGVLGQFNGLSQITMTAITSLGTARRMYLPRAVTAALTENEESEFIAIATPVVLVTPSQWTGAATAYNVDVATVGTPTVQTYQMRIPANSDFAGRPAPTGPFLLMGIGSQFDNSSPYTEGYQIIPRRFSDLSIVQSAKDPAFAKTLALYPNPTTSQLTLRVEGGRGAQVEIMNALGQVVSRTVATADATSLNVASLKAGVYGVRITTAEGSATRRFVKQ